jgi:hypothetical protein
MKRNLIGLLALLVCGAAWATQDTDITPREVRDPKQLETWLEANAADAQSRLATIETAVPSATLISNKYLKVWHPNGSTTTTNLTVSGTVTVPSGSIAAAAVAAGLTVAQGGSGAATFTAGGILCGNGTSAFTALGVAANGQIPIGDGTTAPTLATISGTANEVDIANGAGTITVGLPNNVTVAGNLTVSGSLIGSVVSSNVTGKLWTSNLTAYGTITLPSASVAAAAVAAGLTVAQGGTGAATLTEGGMLCGGGTGAITALGVAANGQIPIGDGTTAPTLATITATAGETEVSNGAGTITIGLPSTVTGVTVLSNATAKAYIQTLEVVSGGAVTVPSASIALAALAGGAVKNGTASTTDLRIRYGTATNGQAVTWGETFTAVVFADIMDDITGTNCYFSAVTTSGGTAVVAASHTNRWMVIGR